MIDYTLPLDELPDPLPIVPLTKPFDVTITPPGSKSITNRAYVLAALAKGESRIIRPLRADDTDLLLEALCTLGAEAKWVPGETGDGSEDVLITGVDGRFPRGGHVNLGDGGTPTRFMIACACLAAQPVIVDGSKRMRERPIAEGVDMLRQLGAKIEYVEEEGRLPVRVVPSEDFRGGELTVGKTASSQFVSALMLIGSSLSDGIFVRFASMPTSQSYLRLTIETLRIFGVKHRRNMASRFSRRAIRWMRIPFQTLIAKPAEVDVDASSMLYWSLATLAFPKSLAFARSLPVWSGQPDLKAIFALHDFGATTVPWERNGGSDGIATDSALPVFRKSKSVHCDQFPDGSLATAIAACLAGIETRLAGLHTLRVKETDRIAALETELRKVGCRVETTDDSITIWPLEEDNQRTPDHPIIIETYNDHRMAMAFAVLGLRVPGIQIANPKVVSKSYPTFWKDFAKLYE